MTRSSRLLPDLAGLSPGERGSLVAFAALLVLVTAALFAPRGAHPHDGGLTPTTASSSASPSASPTAPPATPSAPADTASGARDEIDRVLSSSPDRVGPGMSADLLARRLVRCAEFEEQRYCLGLGWTTLSPREARQQAAAPGPDATETTGDRSTADLLSERAGMTLSRRRTDERRELRAAARSAPKVAMLRHEVSGEPLPASLATRGRTSTRAKGLQDYPERSTVLRARRTSQQRRTYWCGPATMQMIAWGWQHEKRGQRYWARRLGTTSRGSSITDMVRVVNRATGYDREDRAGRYVVLDVSDWTFRQWLLLQVRHIADYRAPVVLHPLLHKRYFPYLDDDASGHFQVGRGYDKRGDRPPSLGYFEPWNQQRFDPSEPFIQRVQWRSAYRSYRANQAHPQQNIGV